MPARQSRRSTKSKANEAATTKRTPPLSISLEPLLVDGSDAEFRRLIYRMLITQARLDDVRRRIAGQVGVSSAQYPMVMAIFRLEEDEGVTISRLADYLEVTGPHVTGEVRKLVAAGVVSKTINPDDLRSVRVRLSMAGRKRLLASFEYIRQVNDILFCGVSAEEFRVLVEFNGRFMSNTAAALAWTNNPTNNPSSRDRDGSVINRGH